MTVEIKKCSNVKGTIKAPPSKSMAHRLLICALLADGKSIIRNLSLSEDISATIDCIKALGAEVDLFKENDGTYTAEINSSAQEAPSSPVLNCRESGSTLRFFIPISLILGKNAVFTGSKRLFERSVSVYEQLSKEKGFELIKEPQKIIACGKLPGGEYVIPGGISSQFISGLLFALPLAEKDSIIKITPPLESASYIDLTLEALKAFNIAIEKADKLTYTIKGNQKYRACNMEVEGDYSNAAFFDAFNYIGGDVTLTGLAKESAQGDKVFYTMFEKLRRGKSEALSLADCPDLGPILFALSAALYGGRFTDTKRLKIKESDRALSMKLEIEKFGCPVFVSENEVVIGDPEAKSIIHKPDSPLDGHNDHRIVMALSVLASITGGTINGAEAINKSLPNFFEMLKSIGLEIEYV